MGRALYEPAFFFVSLPRSTMKRRLGNAHFRE